MAPQFYSLPAWRLHDSKTLSDERLDPQFPTAATVESVLAGVEYRGTKAFDRARELVDKSPLQAIYAISPTDLPALLRTADQLLAMSQRASGERAQVWRCQCGARFAVPLSLLRPVNVRCETCKRTLDLDPTKPTEIASMADPELAEINACRKALADFFREAMARGWPVLVSRSA